jgi:hypothetical protein
MRIVVFYGSRKIIPARETALSRDLKPSFKLSKVLGYTVGFITLAAIAFGGLIFFALLMPETKPEESTRLKSPQGDTPTQPA